jgi:hypothetical protein
MLTVPSVDLGAERGGEHVQLRHGEQQFSA